MSQVSENRLTSEEEYRTIFRAVSDGLVIYDIGLDSVVEANPAACAMHGYTRDEFIGLNPAVFMPPENLALFREQARSAKPGLFEASMVHLRKDGSAFHVEVRRSMMMFRDRSCLLSIIRDISQRLQTEKNPDIRVESQMHELATLLAISHTLASTLEFQPGLILDQLREIVEYAHCGFFVFEESALVTLALRGNSHLDLAPPLHIPMQEAETQGMLFKGHRPIRIVDVWEDQPQAETLRTLFDNNRASALIEGMHSWMWVPLAVKGRMIGELGLAHGKRNFFTSHHADLALSVANQAAITIVNTELNRQAQELAVLEERQKLARNLHDAINQSLFSAGLIAEVLPRLWERDQAEARHSLEDLRKLTRGAMAEMRALLAELRPSTLIDAELGDLLGLLANAFTGRTNVPAKVTVVGQGTLPADVQVALYRVCQEALNNIAKHAAAGAVEIHLNHNENVTEVTIRDNGQGFDPEQIASGHYGLSMMRERAEGVGAQLSITSRPGHGTELTLRWMPGRMNGVQSKEDE